MEATLSISPRHRPSPLPPPPLPTNLRHPHQNVPNRAQFLMPLIDLAFRHSSTKAPFQLRSKIPQFPIYNRIKTSIRPQNMADREPEKTEAQKKAASNVSESRVEEKKGSEKPAGSPVPPPPPEKPLPGDCCGSGCVRCVWDVYYEELEEYNKLHKAN